MNPVLIIIMIPLFEGAIYPLMNRLNVPTRPLARMCTGMLLGGLAFVLAGVIQLRIEVGANFFQRIIGFNSMTVIP